MVQILMWLLYFWHKFTASITFISCFNKSYVIFADTDLAKQDNNNIEFFSHWTTTDAWFEFSVNFYTDRFDLACKYTEFLLKYYFAKLDLKHHLSYWWSKLSQRP